MAEGAEVECEDDRFGNGLAGSWTASRQCRRLLERREERKQLEGADLRRLVSRRLRDATELWDGVRELRLGLHVRVRRRQLLCVRVSQSIHVRRARIHHPTQLPLRFLLFGFLFAHPRMRFLRRRALQARLRIQSGALQPRCRRCKDLRSTQSRGPRVRGSRSAIAGRRRSRSATAPRSCAHHLRPVRRQARLRQWAGKVLQGDEYLRWVVFERSRLFRRGSARSGDLLAGRDLHGRSLVLSGS